MRIDRLELRNFKKFAEQILSLHSHFTLLVGENGSGKTSVLDALAIALGVWLVRVPDSLLANSRRPITVADKRLKMVRTGDRSLFEEATGEVSVKATGSIGSQQGITWEERIPAGKKTPTYAGAKKALEAVQQAYASAQRGEDTLLPVIAYYGAGRAWLPHNRRIKAKAKYTGPARRWAAFYDCLNERIRMTDLADWFQGEAIAKGNQGRSRLGFDHVRWAVVQCVPGADDIWYDGDRKEIVLSIEGQAQPFANLSAGQRMMLAMVADIAIKAVTQNNFLVNPSAFATAFTERTPRVLAETPGVVLIDELDVHLHPRWQRRVASDLKQTFPSVQFVCTSHSPQVIGEVSPDEIRLLDEPHVGERPAHSFGLDSNAILEEVMNAESRTLESQRVIEAAEQALENGDLEAANQRLRELKQLQQGDTRDTARIEATIKNLGALADARD
jgi:predicted ATP-binding protein involved in virulence